MSGPDYSYGAHVGEYGGIGPYGYGSQPGEYGIDANHGMVRLLQSLEYGSGQGPAPIPPRVVTPTRPPRSRPRGRLRRVLGWLALTLALCGAFPDGPPRMRPRAPAPHHTQPVHRHRH